ncbi:hypothetical protein HD597_006992 [Nonomuraea thailandensis]|uniref:Uncharacterized protein n=1 Tax=Nonomuraea thailandensis TaxID=1188745 RepID=A0A9X2GKN5_9ACTN|nr:hypothetical protein [Nonomuraea thailandensis]MCP2359972.1 hypothetical protein [Nonomuraea thailandensis]
MHGLVGLQPLGRAVDQFPLPAQATAHERRWCAMRARPCFPLPLPGDSPAWRLILVIILLIFASVAHTLGIATEVIVLLITTVVGAATQLVKPSAATRLVKQSKVP